MCARMASPSSTTRNRVAGSSIRLASGARAQKGMGSGRIRLGRPTVEVSGREAVGARLFQRLPFAACYDVAGSGEDLEVELDLLAQRVGRGADALDADDVEPR